MEGDGWDRVDRTEAIFHALEEWPWYHGWTSLAGAPHQAERCCSGYLPSQGREVMDGGEVTAPTALSRPAVTTVFTSVAPRRDKTLGCTSVWYSTMAFGT